MCTKFRLEFEPALVAADPSVVFGLVTYKKQLEF